MTSLTLQMFEFKRTCGFNDVITLMRKIISRSYLGKERGKKLETAVVEL